ncbi:hypothetical protein ACFPJ1_40480 [Kribbella qitaiheensis]|uniref:hypothetical protein n=1 Tax=Kribbella qitaiheensis TaxID=1544730 RepID=UPI0036213110
MPTKAELSRRCLARICFPGEPYHNLRCSQKPHDPRDLHTVTTTVPTEYVPAGTAAKPAMATVRITWADQPTTNTN